MLPPGDKLDAGMLIQMEIVKNVMIIITVFWEELVIAKIVIIIPLILRCPG